MTLPMSANAWPLSTRCIVASRRSVMRGGGATKSEKGCPTIEGRDTPEMRSSRSRRISLSPPPSAPHHRVAEVCFDLRKGVLRRDRPHQRQRVIGDVTSEYRSPAGARRPDHVCVVWIRQRCRYPAWDDNTCVLGDQFDESLHAVRPRAADKQDLAVLVKQVARDRPGPLAPQPPSEQRRLDRFRWARWLPKCSETGNHHIGVHSICRRSRSGR